ncbi:Scr1 family TA system antitoxin-like transcriptional regulator [Kitasatospora sp. NPDC127059]|uniref:Scr1 family TA system antitoxin-like transcriptional regulator n=1 Tax=unclassified Kitasatospora TaxID=2633591 RepID=UPI003654264C
MEFRKQRQHILTNVPLRQFRFVIHETALRMRFPGDAAGLIRHLLYLLQTRKASDVRTPLAKVIVQWLERGRQLR